MPRVSGGAGGADTQNMPEQKGPAAWGRDKDTPGHFLGSQISCNSVDTNESQFPFPPFLERPNNPRSFSCVGLVEFASSLADRSCC